MKNNKYLTLLIAAFFLACASPKKGDLSKRQKKSWYLSIEETPCFGKCPMYYFEINGEGLATLNGKRFMQPLGNSRSVLADSILNDIIVLAASADWESYDSEYTSGYSDLPRTIIRYSIQPQDTFSISYENDLAPQAVMALGDILKRCRLEASWDSIQLD